MATTAQTLAQIRIFRDLSPEDLEELGQRCRWRRYGAEQQILGHLDDSSDVFFIIEGRVRVILYSLAGREVTFRDIEAGQMFGEFSAIDGAPRSANVFALADCLVASMPAETLWWVLRNYPQVCESLLKVLTSQIRLLTERIFEFSALAVKYRIHAELLRLSKNNMADDNTAVIRPAPTHAEIAHRVITHREAVTRELRALTRAGLVERRGRALVVRDVAKLDNLVEEVLGHTI